MQDSSMKAAVTEFFIRQQSWLRPVTLSPPPGGSKYVSYQSADAMNRLEEVEGSCPPIHSYRTATTEENDTNSAPTMPPSTMNSGPSSSTTRSSSRPAPSRSLSTSSPSGSTTRRISRPAPSRSLSTPTPGPQEHHKLSCSLRELYTGSLRVIPHTRTILHQDGTTSSSSHRFKIRILPGWRHGTTITFHNRGSILHPGHPASDVVYTLEERPHKTFLLEGNDLIMRKEITLVEALTGCRFVVTTLDTRRLSVDVGSVIPLGFEMGIEGEGMPVAGEVVRKGRLRIKFEVEFPKELSVEQKEGLKRLLDATDGSATTAGGI